MDIYKIYNVYTNVYKFIYFWIWNLYTKDIEKYTMYIKSISNLYTRDIYEMEILYI